MSNNQISVEKFSNDGSSSEDEKEENETLLTLKLRRLIADSKAYNIIFLDHQCPIVYSNDYNIGFFGVEKMHPFDSKKWGNIYRFLIESGKLTSDSVVTPKEVSQEELRIVHSRKYLCTLNYSCHVAVIVEIPCVALIPICLVERRLLKQMRLQTGGSILAARLALERGWAINIGGGFHHASSKRGGGFCIYADITLALRFLFLDRKIRKAMIVDLDVHQGNGHERDFLSDSRIYIFDMYNTEIYPRDSKAKAAIRRQVPLRMGTRDSEYLQRLRGELKTALKEFSPDLIVYNAGTDILDGDPLGGLLISPQGIIARDECVFELVRREHEKPIVMLTSGGYLRESARVIADSILNLDAKNLIELH